MQLREIATFGGFNNSDNSAQSPQNSENEEITDNLNRKQKIYSEFQDESFEAPIYNIWNFSKKYFDISGNARQ